MAVPFIIGLIPSDYGSFETNNLPTDPASMTREIDMTDMSAHGSYSNLSSLSVDTSNHTKTLFSIVIDQYGRNTWTARGGVNMIY